MALNHFLAALFETGRVPVDDPDGPMEAAAEVEVLLATFDGRAREQLAFAAPEFSPDAARWAAVLMYRACQLVVFRKLDAQAVKQTLSAPCPTRLSPGTIYSADLLLQILPELTTMARAVAEQDVLVAELQRIGCRWPLSSVGIPQLAANQFDPQALEMIMDDRCLRQLYMDRIIARRDRTRLAQAGVLDGVREAIGMHDELWPEAARHDER